MTGNRSTMDDKTIGTNWIGPGCCKNILTAIVLSSNVEIIEKISEALINVHQKGNFRWKLVILRSQDLEDVVKTLSLSGKIAIDFFIIALDTSRLFLDWTRKVIGQIHPNFRTRRIILINAGGLAINSMSVNAGDLLGLISEFGLDMLTTNVFKTDEVASMARRVIKYLEVSIGVKTGLPNLNV